jgi:DNA-binding transcriptional MocR family regulator
MTEHLIRTMSGQLTFRIREKILTGAYPPGSPLLQDVIAAEFGVSKIPVREALVQLRAEGLVDVFAHRGFQVRPLSAMEVSTRSSGCVCRSSRVRWRRAPDGHWPPIPKRRAWRSLISMTPCYRGSCTTPVI